MLKLLKHFDLKSFRLARRMSQVELGKMLGVSGNLISSMENGKSPMSLTTFDKLRHAFPDVDLRDFQKEDTAGTVQEPGAPFLGENGKVLLDMYQEKDRQLTHCHEQNASLLREIIQLKDELARLRKKP